MPINFEQKEIWFITGSQLLYGDETIREVNRHSSFIVDGLNQSGILPLKIVYQGTVLSATEISEKFRTANKSSTCAGIIVWMHTFSPAKMWIGGLKSLQKPLLHLHTQFQREIPWREIDMDYMNLNQSAHGDREFGYMTSRMRKARKVVAGYWENIDVRERIAVWMRVCFAWEDAQKMKILRFGDNMNNVAVTDGDKIEAELKFGYHIDYCPVGDLAEIVDTVTEQEINHLVEEYESLYTFSAEAGKSGTKHQQVREAARIEIALRRILKQKEASAFTTNFDALHGLNQLPGLASQRLMNEGYGFGAEGDWKTAALVRTMKVMSSGLSGGTSFLEDYVYHFKGEGAVLQAHMLEICPSIAAQKPRLEVHPLGIGGKADPARLVFTAHEGYGVAVTVVDMGNRFRMILNEADCVLPEADLPKLPVARAFWIPRPNLTVSAEAWILAGGTHHTSFSFALTPEYFDDYAEIADMELLKIGNATTTEMFKKELRFNEVYYLLNRAVQS
ncbi:MAG: L-arabinose isomerase [Planctomycetaceae bacterium]|jgi:L-arabinose isomerase|nr:L-arabinose isomerase [Planctomycetaceae bacterium]